MKFKLFLALITVSLSTFAQEETTKQEIKWLTFEEAMLLNEKEPKKIFIDVYTDWCGWCKKMDATTFQDEKVVAYMQDYYCVKLNAEQKESIHFNGKDFVYIAKGNRGHHEVAALLLDGNMAYPSFVVLAPNLKRLEILKGYLDKTTLLARLKAIP
jgi:thioredoxin-related protein